MWKMSVLFMFGFQLGNGRDQPMKQSSPNRVLHQATGRLLNPTVRRCRPAQDQLAMNCFPLLQLPERVHDIWRTSSGISLASGLAAFRSFLVPICASQMPLQPWE